MTREEAIEGFKNLYNDIDKFNNLFVGTINPNFVLMAIKSLEAWDELYKKIYDHHYEIIRSEPSESRNAKLSLSNWMLDTMTGYDFES